MAGVLQKLRQRLYRVEETAVRVEELRTELAQLTQAVADTRKVVTASLEYQQALLAETRSAALNAHSAVVAGFAASDWRSEGIARLRGLRELQGRAMAVELARHADIDWQRNQFSVYSQFGEDGLIQLVIRLVTVETPTFVEFGVEDYQQATTRFLLVNDHWRGLVMDGSAENVAAIKADPISQWHDLQSKAAFVTRDNIDALLTESGFGGALGLLCIDIDGNDYWIWDAITAVNPIIVIVEYNYRFGPELKVVVPYDPGFSKNEAHPSAIYYGASLAAIGQLASRKGYAFVGCSEGGVNAFFVRRDRLPDTLPERSIFEGYVEGRHAEMRDACGRIVKAPLAEQLELLLTLPLIRLD